ncbi:hypothetical protein ACVXHB_24895 [Escherichia coli]
MVRLGYDSMTTVLVTYIATQIGFASSSMNPFCVVVAQDAGVPVLSGSGLRIVVCGYRHSDWPKYYHGVRLTSEKESSSVTRA